MDLVKSAEVFHFVSSRIKAGRKTIIANHNLHSLYLIQKDDELRAFFSEADLVEVDSMPLIFWARVNGRASRRFHRATYLDWRDEFWNTVREQGWRVFFLGSEPGVAEQARERIVAQWPGVQLATHHGYFDMAPGFGQERRHRRPDQRLRRRHRAGRHGHAAAGSLDPAQRGEAYRLYHLHGRRRVRLRGRRAKPRPPLAGPVRRRVALSADDRPAAAVPSLLRRALLSAGARSARSSGRAQPKRPAPGDLERPRSARPAERR